MWVSGGGPGAEHDRRVLEKNGLLEVVPEGELGIGDKGYQKEEYRDKLVWPIFARKVHGRATLTWGEHLYNLNLCSLRVEIERVFGRMKKAFAFLQLSRDRNLHEHRKNFNVLAHTLNIMLEFQPMRKNAPKYFVNPPATLPTPPRALQGNRAGARRR